MALRFDADRSRPIGAGARNEDRERVDELAGRALVGVAALALVVLGAGQLSGLATSGVWPPLAGTEIPGVLARIPSHWSDPGQAWPQGARPLVGGPLAWWACFVVLASLALSAMAIATGGDRDGAWARAGDLRRLRVWPWGRSARLAIGRHRGRLVATEARHSLLVFGPTQSGKTTGLAIPAILEWKGPVIATSVKDDLLAQTQRWRSRRGHVWVYDPAGATGCRSAGWSPLQSCHTWQGAKRMAAELADAARVGGSRGTDNADFWFAAAAKLLAPYLFAAANAGLTMSEVVAWIDLQERDEAKRVLVGTRCAPALLAFGATWKRDDRTRTSIFTTAELVIAAYSEPAVAASAVRADIDPARFLDGGAHTLYLTAPPADQRRLRPLFATLVGQVTGAAYAKVAAQRRPLDPPLLVVLDEAANIAPVPELATLASTAAAQGIQLVTVWQDLAQLQTRYGREAGTVLNNHRAKLALGGVGDLDTLEYVSRLAGERDPGRARGGDPRRGARADGSSRLLHPGGLRRLKAGRGVLVYGNLPPARIRLRPWYRSLRLRSRARPGRGQEDGHGRAGSVAAAGGKVSEPTS